VTELPFDADEFDAIPDGLFVHDNRFSGGGDNPSGEMGALLTSLVGKPFPDILFDGAVEPQKLIDGTAPSPMPHRFVDNGDADFANFNFTMLSPRNVLTGKYRVERNLDAYTANLDPLLPVTLAPHDPPDQASDAAVRVYRSLPKKLSEYRLFKGNGRTQEPAEGVVSYDLNTPLFSDYTTKYRFIRVPEGKQIKFREDGVFDFPVGTIIAKTFSYPHDMTNPAKGERLLETRIELLRDEGWYGFTYVWNDEQTEATLALGGGEADVSWTHTDGTTRSNDYQIPNANQCLSCHSQGKDFVPIGPTAANLNRSFAFAHGEENQLAHMSRLALLHGAPAHEAIEPLPRFDDATTGSVPERARAWLHVNCAHCHSPEGSARTSGLDLRLTQDESAKLGVWKAPIAAGHGSGGRTFDIVPGKPDESILMFRLESTEPSVTMPNVAKRLVPVEAVQLVREWIEQMEPSAPPPQSTATR
jgi:uncharacterized repeat protein (TIGR03806 family)